MSQRTRAVFLDKDGTLVEDVPYNVDPTRIVLVKHALPALRRMHAAGYELFIVSNQSGVARGLFPESALVAVEARLRQLLARAHVPLAGFFYCPHHPNAAVAQYAIPCDCRKPAPGLILRAAQQHAIDLARSWVIGDILDNVEAGRRAGCETVMIVNGNESEWILAPQRRPHHLCTSLLEASDIVCASAPAAASGRGRRAAL
jgi:histidinol-phosphate phosphatase family protein